MKRKLIVFGILMTLMTMMLSGCGKKNDLTKITLNEVAHSIFYAPMYVAIEKGYFEEEGIDLELVNGLGADKTMTAVLSGDADIGFMGSEASIYVYAEGAEDYVVNFAQLTQRAGNFLVSRKAEENFSYENLIGTTIIGGRAGGMPEMVFEYILKKNGIDPTKDLTIVQNIDFGLTAQAFASGQGDYTIEFEPGATSLETEGAGTVVASLGVDSGKVPYTAYSAKKSYLEKHPDTIQKFVNAVQKGLDYVNSHTPEEIADAIKPQFPDTDKELLATVVKRYKDQNSWKTDPVLIEKDLGVLQKALLDAGELNKAAPYDKIVTTVFAESAKDNIK